MTIDSDRRRVMQLSLLAATLIPVGYAGSAFAASTAKPAAGGAGPEHDFDFFLGSWKVRHRRLKQRLVNSNEWDEFDGATQCQSLLGGIANMNDSIVNRPTGTYRSMGLRAFDMKTDTWVDWSLDGRDPTRSASTESGGSPTASAPSSPTTRSRAGRSGCAVCSRRSRPTRCSGNRPSRSTAARAGRRTT